MSSLSRYVSKQTNCKKYFIVFWELLVIISVKYDYNSIDGSFGLITNWVFNGSLFSLSVSNMIDLYVFLLNILMGLMKPCCCSCVFMQVVLILSLDF